MKMAVRGPVGAEYVKLPFVATASCAFWGLTAITWREDEAPLYESLERSPNPAGTTSSAPLSV